MSSSAKTFLIIFAIAGLLILSSGLFIVNENERAIVLRLGKIETNSQGLPAIKYPGLHFKIPLITSVRLFDVRLQTLDIESSRIVTSEKKDVLVDCFVKWQITDLPTFFTRTGGSIIRAQTLLEQKINDSIRAEFGRRTIHEVVAGERADIMAILREQAKKSVEGLGLKVIDVRIKRIDLPSEVSGAVFERMRAERDRIATEHRAEGKSKSEAIKAKADAFVTVTLAKAESTAKTIKGEGEAMAAKIYADAYSKDPSFYSFYRSMSAYQNTFVSKNDIFVLKPDSRFFQFFNGISKQKNN